MTVDELARLFALERRLLERLSTGIEPFEHGTAFLDAEFRERYDSNVLLGDGPLEGVPAAALVDAADRILGAAGYEHREVLVRGERQGERLAPGFVQRGYVVEPCVVMAHRHDPDRAPDLVTEECSFEEVRPLRLEVNRREPWASSEQVVRMLADYHRKLERVIGARFFAVRVEGALAGACDLYVDGPDAQVEDVDTLLEHRNRGVARAVVLRAVRAAREAGARHVFIVADASDWPKDLYARLGFEPIGRTWQFNRWPERARRSEPGSLNP